MIPYNARLWGVHAERDHQRAGAQRFVPLPKLEDVIAGAVGLNDRELGYNANFVYPRRGIGELADGHRRAPAAHRSSARAPRRIDLGERASSSTTSASLRRAREHRPAPCARSSCSPTVPTTPCGEAARRLRCSHLYYLDVALNRACRAATFTGPTCPEAKYPFYRVGCYSHFSAALAPENKGSLYVELADRARRPISGACCREVDRRPRRDGRHRRPERDIALRARCAGSITRTSSSITTITPRSATVRRVPATSSRILSAGRYGGWNYSSMEDALRFGRDAAHARRRSERDGAACLVRTGRSPQISIVIPVYNEQAILHAAVVDLRERLAPFGWTLRDHPGRERLARPHASRSARSSRRSTRRCGCVSAGEPNYGLAMQRGIARRPRRARALRRDRPLRHGLPPGRASSCSAHRQADMVIGSKLIAGARGRAPRDPPRGEPALHRPAARRCSASAAPTPTGSRPSAATRWRGVARAASTDKDVFASEFVIRAYRAGLRVRRDPDPRASEKRPPRSTSSSACRTCSRTWRSSPGRSGWPAATLIFSSTGPPTPPPIYISQFEAPAPFGRRWRGVPADLRAEECRG